MRNSIFTVSLLIVIISFSSQKTMAEQKYKTAECNIDYKRPDFKGFESLLEDKYPDIKILSPEKIDNHHYGASKNVTMEHQIRLKDGIVIKHNISCRGDVLDSMLSFYELHGYDVTGITPQIVESVDKIVSRIPVKEGSNFKNDWQNIKQHVLVQLPLTKPPRYYVMNQETRKYEKFPRQCHYGSKEHKKELGCPERGDSKAVLHILPNQFNIHLDSK